MSNKKDQPSYLTIGFRASTPLIKELDQWCNSQTVPPSRSDVIKLAIAQFLQRQAEGKRR
jgi:metal-responsive CopG/Arc/MetJ family transcriptional regulator